MEGYKHLNTYILATVIDDLTMEFVKRWIRRGSRTRDQMEQGARSGKQNIAEGYTTQSLEGYIKLCGVAEGSQKELAADYEDFLRQNKLPRANSPRYSPFGLKSIFSLQFIRGLKGLGILEVENKLAIWGKEDPRVRVFRGFREARDE